MLSGSQDDKCGPDRLIGICCAVIASHLPLGIYNGEVCISVFWVLLL
jgi:hypothetical protein